MTMQRAEVRAAIAAMGSEIGPASLGAVHALYDLEQRAVASAVPVTAADVAYGEHSRHRLDVYAPQGAKRASVVVWVHGGGFVRGDKGGDDLWPNAHAGRFAAGAGFIGVVSNYRLAPGHGWPAGGEDIGAVVDWLLGNAARFGGDGMRIVLVGTSAGAAHIATFLQLRPKPAGVRGAVLLSGVYGVTAYDDARDLAYYGPDARLHTERAPLDALVATEVPLLVACSEFDPPRFQAEFTGLMQRRLDRHGRMPRGFIGTGHNHFSLAYHLGTSDTRLGDEIAGFVREVCAVDQLD